MSHAKDQNEQNERISQPLTLPLLPPANEVWGKVIFSQACIIPSVHGGRGGFPACITGHMTRGICLGWGLHPGGSASGGIRIQWCLHPGQEQSPFFHYVTLLVFGWLRLLTQGLLNEPSLN